MKRYMWLLIYCVGYARGSGVSRRQEGIHIASNWHLYYYWDISSVWEYSRSTLRCTKVIGIIYIPMIFVTPSGVYKNSMIVVLVWENHVNLVFLCMCFDPFFCFYCCGDINSEQGSCHWSNDLFQCLATLLSLTILLAYGLNKKERTECYITKYT